MAYQAGLDLVEINPHTSPPICKLIDFGKYKYELEKEERKRRAKTKGPQVKEIRISLKIEKHDFQIKLKRAREFLEKGDKIKLVLPLLGRENIFRDKAIEMINKFKIELGVEFEEPPKKLGNRFIGLLVNPASRKATRG